MVKMAAFEKGTEFVLELIFKSAGDGMSCKVFDNLRAHLNILMAQKQTKAAAQIQMQKVFEKQLNLYKFAKDVELWLRYLDFLTTFDPKAASREYQRALVILRNDSSIKGFNKLVFADNQSVERLMSEYTKISK